MEISENDDTNKDFYIICEIHVNGRDSYKSSEFLKSGIVNMTDDYHQSLQNIHLETEIQLAIKNLLYQ